YRIPRTEYSCPTTRSASRSRMGPVRVTRPCEAMTSIEFGWEATRPSLARTRSPNTSSGTAWCLSEAQACARNPPARFPRSRRALSRARLQKLLAWTALSRSHMLRLFPETGSNRYMSRLPTATPVTQLRVRPYCFCLLLIVNISDPFWSGCSSLTLLRRLVQQHAQLLVACCSELLI